MICCDTQACPEPSAHGGNRSDFSGASPGRPREPRTLIDELLADEAVLRAAGESQGTAVDVFAREHGRVGAAEGRYTALLPAAPPGPGQQYAFEVDLDKCSGCKACVTACHALNGLDEDESWREVGVLIAGGDGGPAGRSFQQHVTTACHHCADPGCLNGCPVLAYDKDPATGIVRHLDDQCMGCSYCILKCPYEVPRYSERLGIVRKCDMCSGRLAAGEAPACAQACPNEAIRITVVAQADLRTRYGRGPNDLSKAQPRRARDGRGPGSSPRESSDPRPNPFLPDTPDPRLTLPATKFLASRAWPANVVAADRDWLRLDSAHRPLVVMLVLTQTAVGMWLAGVILGASGFDVHYAVVNGVAMVLLAAGLGASVWHLGRPGKAWRSFLGWRRSWLSREIIAFNMAVVAGLLAVAAAGLGWPPAMLFATSALAGAVGLAGVLASAMVYIDTGRPWWCARWTSTNFLGTTFLLGAAVTGVVVAWMAWAGRWELSGAARWAAVVTMVIRAALFGVRWDEVRRALAEPASPRCWNARVIREKLPGTFRWQTALFVGSTVTGLLAIGGAAGLTPIWASLSACSTLAGELLSRHVFFVAGGARRMPGGLTP